MKLKLFWNAIIHYKNLGVLLISLGIGLAAAEFVEFPRNLWNFPMFMLQLQLLCSICAGF